MAGLDAVGVGSIDASAASLIMSIRDKIPDPVTDPSLDGASFKLTTLVRWINDAMRLITLGAPVIVDWWAVPTVQGMNSYEVPSYIVAIDQAWYDRQNLTKLAEIDTIFRSKPTGWSWWFGMHSTTSRPVLMIFPDALRTAGTTTLTSDVTATDLSLPIASGANFQVFGYVTIDGELIMYRNIPGGAGNITNILRGQGGTEAAAHVMGTQVQECNLMLKCTRLAQPITGPNDNIEVPQGLWPLIELYVISNVREAEQDTQLGMSLRQEFNAQIKDLGSKASQKQARHGIQVRVMQPGPELYGGRVFIP
jgi:hypothetical protein